MPNYQVWTNGQGQGPYTVDQLLQSGLNAETLVWTEGMLQWTPARLVPELSARLGVLMSSPQTMYQNYATPGVYAARPRTPGAGLKWGSFSTMLVALLCFFAPFFNITCAGTRLLSASGIELATKGDSEVKNPIDGSGTGRKEQNPAQMMALVALLATVAGVVAAFLPGKIGPMALVGCALVAAICVFMVKAKIDSVTGPKIEAENKSAFGDPTTSSSGANNSPGAALAGARVIQLDYSLGFFGPVVMYIAALVLGVFWLMKAAPKDQSGGAAAG